MNEELVNLIQAAMQGDEQALQLIEQIQSAAQQGNQEALQLAQQIQQIIQAMQQQQQQQVQAAKFGAKLNYIKSLRGVCPEGYEAKYFKSGGSLVKKCAKCQHQEMMANGGKTKDPIDNFKKERNLKKKDVTKALKGVKVPDNPQKKKEHHPLSFDRRELSVGNGRSVISDVIFKTHDDDGFYLYDSSIPQVGRTIYTSPTGNDTIYWNTPKHSLEYRHGFMKVGEGAHDQNAAKNRFYKHVNWSVPLDGDQSSVDAFKRAKKGN